MNSNFNLNSYRNFNSNYFQLIPAKYVTFGVDPINEIGSNISEIITSKNDNSIFLGQSQSQNKPKINEGNNNRNNTPSKENIINTKEINKEIASKKEMPIYFNNSFQIGSKTILNSMNTCLLDLFSNTKNNSENSKNNANTTKNDYMLTNILNEDFLSEIKINNNENITYLMEKMKLNQIKGINKDEIENKSNKKENEDKERKGKIIETKTDNLFKTKTKLDENINDKIFIQGAFKLINNNYKNPAKNNAQIFEDNIMLNKPQGITNISNITNITNNYYFQCDNSMNLLKKKTKRNQGSSSKKKTKVNYNNNNNMNIKIKKENDLTYGLYQLNQISVNGVSISKFPVVSMNEDDLEIQLLSKMLTDTEYFTIVDKYYINIPVLDEEKYNKPFYDKIFKKEKEKIANLYLIGDNLNENNPIKLIKNYYCQIKDKILKVQKNYLNNNKKAHFANIELCKEIEKLIISCNAITNTVTDYKKSGLKRKLFMEHNNNNTEEDEKSKIDSDNIDNNNNINTNNIINSNNNNNNKKENNININENNGVKKNDIIENKNTEKNFIENSNDKRKKIKRKHFKTYLCEFCNKAYSNGQGLGGHMSRIHPNQSYKYKDKIRIRREREKKREKLLIIKQELFKKYGYNYDKLIGDKNKGFIQKFLLAHNEEYKNLRKNQKKENNNENISENEKEYKKSKNILLTPLPIKMTNLCKRIIDSKEDNKGHLSKEKTMDKTELKKNMENDKINEIGYNPKLKINFAE